MYDETDLNRAEEVVRKTRLLMLIPALLLLGGVVWSFIVRIKWLTILLSILAGCWIIFIRQIFLLPRRGYRQHIDRALHDAKKEAEGRYLRMETTPVERDNVMYYAFYLNVGEKQDPADDRLFYYDAFKPLPCWQSGDRLHVISYDKFVSSYKVISHADASASA